jgi:hypothetical protein
MRQLVTFFFLVLLTATACKRTKALYEKGEYDRAVFNSVERLRNSHDNRKARETLKVAYPAMVDYLETEIAQEKQTAQPLRWERIVAHYAILNQAHDDILRAPAAKRIIPRPRDYTREQTEATRNAAEARYELGQVYLRQGEAGDRQAARIAYDHFVRAIELRPGYRDAEQQAERARVVATLYVEIEPIPMGQQSLRLSNAFFQNQIFEFASSSTLGRFVHLYPTGTLRVGDHQPDHIVRMSFDEFTVGQTQIKETEAERSAEVVVEEIQVTEDSVRKVYGTVKARVNLFEKKITSQGRLDVQVIDAYTGSIISQRKFPGTYVWVDRWGYLNGDKRALTQDDEAFMNKKQPSREPSNQYLFEQFTQPIRNQVVSYLSNYYRNF